MSAVPDELARARRDEIVNACAELYETMSFRDITLKEIGQRTSFTRTSIYNYFQTREEIFLALFQREYEDWTHDLLLLRCSHEAMTAEEFACALAETLARRERLLKLMSMNLYDMEDNSRLGSLVEFKGAYAAAMEAVTRCLERFFPAMGEREIREFLFAFFPFLFGVYPYTTATDKQIQAMELAGVAVPRHSIYEIVRALVIKLLPAAPG